MPLAPYVGLRSLSTALIVLSVFVVLLTGQKAKASEPNSELIDAQSSSRDSVRLRVDRSVGPGRSTFRVPPRARLLLLSGAASSLLGAALTTFAMLDTRLSTQLPRDLVTGLSASGTSPWVAAGLGGMLSGHLLTQVGVSRAKKDSSLLGTHFVLRTQLALNPQGFMIGVGGRF